MGIVNVDGFDYWNELGKEQLAIMRNVRWGIIDSDHYPKEPTIGLSVDTIGGSADLRLTAEQSVKLAVSSGAQDITKLSGKPCVIVKDDGYLRWIRLYT